MKKIFILFGVLTVGLFFWTALGYLMQWPSLSVVFPTFIASTIVFFISGFLKNREEKKKFREFLDLKEQDPEVQEKLKNERIEPGDKTGRAGIKTHFKDRNVGVNWMAANIHGAVPQRKKRRTFLPKNR